MSDAHGASLAQSVADRLRTPGPWEVYAEQTRRYEVHLRGTTVELVRGPIAVEGYGVRLVRPHDGKLGTGFQASSDFSDAGIRAVVDDAETNAKYSEFPAKSVELPGRGSVPPNTTILDRSLWEEPAAAVDQYLTELRNAFASRKSESVSFGSVKTTRTRSFLANSAGFVGDYAHTTVDLEFAVKATGGPEGAPPGEYWVTDSRRRLEPQSVRADVERWCRFARDARTTASPPSGEQAVVLPAGVLAGIVPAVLGVRASGTARLLKIGLEPGSQVGSSAVTIDDDGAYPWSVASGPIDAEGTATRTTPVVDQGKVRGLVYDSLHGAAFSEGSTGNGYRSGFGPRPWVRFAHAVSCGASTLVVRPGTGGSDEELIQAAGEGLWVQQLGWANPDAYSGMYGGEIRLGYRIRNGKLAEPVRGGIVGGPVLAPPGTASLLAHTVAIGSKVELCDSLASPTWLVRPVTVAGTSG